MPSWHKNKKNMEKNFLRMSLEELEQMVREAQKLDQLCGAMNTHKL